MRRVETLVMTMQLRLPILRMILSLGEAEALEECVSDLRRLKPQRWCRHSASEGKTVNASLNSLATLYASISGGELRCLDAMPKCQGPRIGRSSWQNCLNNSLICPFAPNMRRTLQLLQRRSA